MPKINSGTGSGDGTITPLIPAATGIRGQVKVGHSTKWA